MSNPKPHWVRNAHFILSVNGQPQTCYQFNRTHDGRSIAVVFENGGAGGAANTSIWVADPSTDVFVKVFDTGTASPAINTAEITKAYEAC